MLLQTKNIYPEWDQLDEVNYWLYKIYLDQREYFHALKLSEKSGTTLYRKTLRPETTTLQSR